MFWALLQLIRWALFPPFDHELEFYEVAASVRNAGHNRAG